VESNLLNRSLKSTSQVFFRGSRSRLIWHNTWISYRL